MPKISIIMPMLNSIKYLRECMDSVIGQTIKDMEILPVDAGSTDGTRELLEEYARKDDRIRILHSDRKSAGYQYNLGIAAALGDYIGFVESDDFIVPEMYEVLWNYAEKTKVDWVKADYFCFMDCFKGGRQKIPVHDRKFCPTGVVFDPHQYPKQYVQEIFMWRGIYRTQWIKENRILLNETPGASFQDTGFVLQAFMCGKKGLYIEDCLYCYRRDHEGSSSHQPNTICYEMDEVEYISKIIEKKPDFKESFWNVNYKRAWERFLSAYERVPELKDCPAKIRHAVDRYRNFLLKEKQRDSLFWENHEMSQIFSKIVWLEAGLEVFDREYRILDREKESVLRDGIRKVMMHKKVIVFGCGDNGSGIISLLLRLNQNEIVCLSDNDKTKWNQEYMGIQVVPPKELSVDDKTVILIANQTYFYEIRAQLIGLGISERQIWLCPQIMRFRGTNLLPEGEILPLK